MSEQYYCPVCKEEQHREVWNGDAAQELTYLLRIHRCELRPRGYDGRTINPKVCQST